MNWALKLAKEIEAAEKEQKRKRKAKDHTVLQRTRDQEFCTR